MKNEKKGLPRMYIIFSLVALLIIVLVVLLTLNKYQQDKKTLEAKLPVEIYFYNPLTTKLEPEKRMVDNLSKTDTMKAILDEWVLGPENANLTATLPPDVAIIEGIITADHVAELKFSKSYLELEPADELVLRTSLVWTLTELEFVDDVRIFVEDTEILTSNEEPTGPLNRDNTKIERPDFNPQGDEKIAITLYFADPTATFLIKEERLVELNHTPTLALEKKLMEELLKGPSDNSMVATIPKETSILDIGLTEGVCDIDFNKEFESKFPGGSSTEMLMIYSIVNTLTESPNVHKVQILVEGNKVSENTVFQMELNKPLERNENLVEDN